MITIPVDFTEKVKLQADKSGYPYQISASHLMENFSYSALDAENSWIEETSIGEYAGRKLKLPSIPRNGIYLLGCVNGKIDWIEAETCS